MVGCLGLVAGVLLAIFLVSRPGAPVGEASPVTSGMDPAPSVTAGPNETVVLTSTDGQTWDGDVEPVLHNLFIHGIHPTTRGIFLSASTNPYLPEDLSENRIAVHRAPLP